MTPTPALMDPDAAFERAIRAGELDQALLALRSGADPNRVLHEPGSLSGQRALYFLTQPPRCAERALGLDFSQRHARLIQAMVEAGADFSLPASLRRASPSASWPSDDPQRAGSIPCSFWSDPLISMDSFVWLAKGKANLAPLFEGDIAAHSRLKRHGSAQEVLAPLWGLVLRPLMERGGGRLELLARALGAGQLDWAQWLINQGAQPLIRQGHSPLDELARETVFFASPERSGHCLWGASRADKKEAAPRLRREAFECARLAASFGEDPAAVLPALLAQRGKCDPEGSLAFARHLASLAPPPLSGHGPNPLLAYALADPANALAQMDFVIGLGADPKDRARRSVQVLLKHADPDSDAAAAEAIRRLSSLGADFSEPFGPAEESLAASAARSGLFLCLQALHAAGCDMAWRSPLGASVLSLAVQWAIEQGKRGSGAPIAAWLIQAGAPADLQDADALTPLARAAKALDSALCQVLLEAGADPNQAVGGRAALTAAHLACARFDKTKEAAQLQTLEILARHNADFAKPDGKGRSPMEIASKKGLLSATLSVALSAAGRALEGESGSRALQNLAARGAGFLSVAELGELSASLPPASSPPSASSKRRSSL